MGLEGSGRVLCLAVTCRAGVTWAWSSGRVGSGQVGLGVRTDVASASGSLRRLVFRVRVFSRGEGLAVRSNSERSRGARRLQVQSGQYFTAMLFDN